MNKLFKKAFTLIELLVVIAIIGILATLAIVTLNNARVSARDSKRVSDIRQIQTALELYFNEHNTYPSVEEWLSWQEAGSNFMKEVPLSPLGGECSASYNYWPNPNLNQYSISFCLESERDGFSEGINYAKSSGMVLDPDLIAWWPLNGDVLDYSVNSNHGQLHGATFTESNKSLYFNGTSDYVDFGGDKSIKPLDKISVSAWIKVYTLGHYGRFISDWHQSLATDRWVFLTRSNTSFEFHVGTPAGSSSPRFYPVFDRWYHIVGIYDGTQIKLYVDANLIGATNKSGLMNDTSESLTVRIGKQLETGPYFHGEMYDVRIYKRDLSEDYINYLYNTTNRY